MAVDISKNQYLHYAWQPGGDWIAVQISESPVRILNVNSITGETFELKLDYPISGFCWSPNGKWLAWWLFSEGTEPQTDHLLGITNFDNHESKLLIQGYGLLGVVWSPDSQWLAFSSRNPAIKHLELLDDIFAVNINTKIVLPLITHPADDSNIIWSP
jgi:WD40 repeat protein